MTDRIRDSKETGELQQGIEVEIALHLDGIDGHDLPSEQNHIQLQRELKLLHTVIATILNRTMELLIGPVSDGSCSKITDHASRLMHLGANLRKTVVTLATIQSHTPDDFDGVMGFGSTTHPARIPTGREVASFGVEFFRAVAEYMYRFSVHDDGLLARHDYQVAILIYERKLDELECVMRLLDAELH